MSNAAKITTPGGSDNGKTIIYNSGTDTWDLTDVVTAAEAAAGYQPLDSDLTAIAALTTTSFGRSLLAAANAAALRTLAGTVIDTDVPSQSSFTAHTSATTSVHGIADTSALLTTSAADAAYQPLDSDLTSIAALSTTSFGRAFLALADAAAARTAIGVVIGTDVQAQDAELAAIAGLVSAADRLPYFTGSGTASLATFTSAGRALVDDADAAAQRTTLGLATVASSGSASDLGTGTLPNARLDQDLQDIAGLTRTKGDLIVGTSSAWVDVAVGTDGHVLTADAAQTSGVKWAAAGAGSFDPLSADVWFASQFWS